MARAGIWPKRFDGTMARQQTRLSAIRVFAAAGLACTVLLVTGCSPPPTSPSPAVPVQPRESGTGDLMVGLITKTDANPFFVTMKDGATRRAGELGVELRTFAGLYDGDSEAQFRAIETLVAEGAHGILITPSDPAALDGPVGRARQAGVLVVALDTPFESPSAVDATFATDNFRAGELVGMWARARMGAGATEARVATLDLSSAQVTVDVLRNQGFLQGFGIDIGNPRRMYDEDDSRLVGHGATMGTETGGRSAMERLMREHPSINLVYAINEPAAAGAYTALRALGVADDVLIVTIDGSCSGVGRVATGAFGATVMQYPVRMATLGVEAVVEFSRTGRKPTNTPGLDFHDTGTALVTDVPAPGIPSIGTGRGLSECWG